jgi:hypothetical protein
MFNSKFFRFVSAACLSFLLCAPVFADTVRLKDGSIIKGKITNFTGGRFTIVIGDDTRRREMSFTVGEVESIVFDSTDSVSAANSNTSSVTTKPAAINTTATSGGQNNTSNTQTTLPPEKPNQTEKLPTTSTPESGNKPITIEVKVLADNTSNGWTNSGWVVQKGQKIKITGNGRVSLGNGRYSTPIGIASLPDAEKLKKDQPTGGLIAVVGDDNNEFIFVGESSEFVATRDGALFLGINEGNLDDNSGTYDVKIEISLEQ